MLSPLAISFQRADCARQSGPILQPQEVEATAAADQSARTEGGLDEGCCLLVDPESPAWHFWLPQTTELSLRAPCLGQGFEGQQGDLRRWMKEERRRAWGA